MLIREHIKIEKNYNYVYLITNMVNGKQYIGDHSVNDILDIDDDYLGSGHVIKNAIKKYGKQNFKREILEYFDTKYEAHIAQEKYIKEYNTLIPNGYNISPTGGTRFNGNQSLETIERIKKSNTGKKRSDITKERISLAKLNMTQKTKDKIGLASKNRSKESNYKCGSANRGKETWMKGKTHLEKSKELIRNKHLGKKIQLKQS